jgi:hypothetical protein
MSTQNRSVIRHGTIACLVAASAISMARTEETAATTTEDGKVVLMHYMPWYESAPVRGRWGGHWAGFDGRHSPGTHDANGLPDIASHFHPLIGPYDSTDPALLDCHLAQMKMAGVDGVVVDWYGVAEALDFPSIHVASVAMFEAAGRYGMAFAACYEDRVAGMMVDRGMLRNDAIATRVAEDLGWLDEHWFPSPTYVSVGGKPLLLNFGPITAKDPAVWRRAIDSLGRRPAFFALHHLWRKAGADGGFTWIHWNPWEETSEEAEVRKRLRGVFALPSADPAEVIVSACPGYKDIYPESRPVLEHADGETLRVSLDEALAGPAKVVQLVTWNDYGEGTMIEPTHEFGYRFLEIVQEANRRRRGPSFVFTAADLRLPERLYRARKQASAAAADLDAVAESLQKGKCKVAAATLDRLGL